ncbi:MAG: hypothetical protein KGL39_38780 [Patescibacteria group bacterium]|nr:hypothetical protein [Patescibacteria group bacterium]
MSNGRIAPDGKRWVCLVCGKTTKDLYGNEGGWDESCILNSRLYDEAQLIYRGARVIRIKGRAR